MNKSQEARRRRSIRRARASAFIKRNGAYFAAAICLAMLGALIALLPSGKNPKQSSEAPAANSLDERLSDAIVTQKPSPAPTVKPIISFEPTPAPTFIPDITPAPSSSPAPTAAAKLNSPVDGRLIKPFSMDALIYSKTLRQWMTHSGVDIAAPKGAEVRAVEAGTVVQVYDDDLMGTTVVIEHESFKTVYSGLKKEPPVKEGDALQSRALIGYVGDTAISECADQSHLHFEIWKDGLPVDPESCVLIPRDA